MASYLLALAESSIPSSASALVTSSCLSTGARAASPIRPNINWAYQLLARLATRAVAFEKRISACIADTPLEDMESLMMAEAPSSSNLSASERALRSTLFDLTAWQVGKTQLSELFDVFKGMKVDDVSRITCPMLYLASTGEAAERIRQTRKIYELLPNPKKAFHLFTQEEGADAHNQANNLSLLHEIVFDWLDEVYSAG